MSDKRYLEWPFLEARHRELEHELDVWAQGHVADDLEGDVDTRCRTLVRLLGDAGFLRHAVAGSEYGGAREAIDTRVICLVRETLARYSGLADFAFAMQGLGSGALSLQGSSLTTPDSSA